jgi:hypothetical protein
MSTSLTSAESDPEEEEARYKRAQAMDDLRERAHNAEQLSDRYQKQVASMQQQLDEAHQDQTASEERDFQRQTEVDRLNAELKDVKRQHREALIENGENEKTFLAERESWLSKDKEQQTTIENLRESLRTRAQGRRAESRSSSLSDREADSDRRRSGALDSQVARLSHSIKVKDERIDTLTFELADAHVKLTELEHSDGRRLLDFERLLQEKSMEIAKLREENEGYLMLMNKKAVRGEFRNEEPANPGMTSLAEELESTEETEGAEGETEKLKKLEADNNTLKAEINALRQYIDVIIGRMLSQPGYEHIFSNVDQPPAPPEKMAFEKALPAVPDQQQQVPQASGKLFRALRSFLVATCLTSMYSRTDKIMQRR